MRDTGKQIRPITTALHSGFKISLMSNSNLSESDIPTRYFHSQLEQKSRIFVKSWGLISPPHDITNSPLTNFKNL